MRDNDVKIKWGIYRDIIKMLKDIILGYTIVVETTFTSTHKFPCYSKGAD